MKKKIVGIFMLAALVMLCGCEDEKPSENKDVKEAVEESVAEDNSTEENIHQEAVEENVQEAEDIGEPEKTELLERVSDDNIKQVLDEILTWAGTKYFYDPVTEFEEIDPTTQIDMAAFACEMNSSEDEGLAERTEDWRLIISHEKIDAKMKALFGIGCDESKYTSYKNSYVKFENGELSISQGDWGLVVPTAEYKAVYSDDSNEFVIEASYTAYDFMDDKNIPEYDYQMTYFCELSSDSENGFIIKNIQSINNGTYPEKFDPSTVAGIYITDRINEEDDDKTKEVAYLALFEDGTGSWLSKGCVPLEFDRYNIYVGSVDNEMPYTIYDDEITIYPDDENYEHYVKTDMTREEFDALVESMWNDEE